MFDRNGVVVLGVLYRDDAHTKPLPGVIGPFESNDAASAYMDSLGPLWGSWNTCPIYMPASPESGVEAKIEASSFGTPEAQALRATVSDEKARELVRRAHPTSQGSAEGDR